MKICKVCGIDFHRARVTYDGYTAPFITKKCGRYINKCTDPLCMTCRLDGGHDFIKNGSGRHKWKEVRADED